MSCSHLPFPHLMMFQNYNPFGLNYCWLLKWMCNQISYHSLTLNVPCCWYSPPGRTSKPPLHIANIMASDDLATPGTKAPTPIYNYLVFHTKIHQSISICIIDQHGYETRCWNWLRKDCWVHFNSLLPGWDYIALIKTGADQKALTVPNFIPERWYRSEYIHTILWWGTKYLQIHHNCVRHYAALITIGQQLFKRNYYVNPHNLSFGVLRFVTHLCVIPVYAAGPF